MDGSGMDALNWRRWYSDRNAWPIDTNLFLADAVTRMGPMAVHPWLDELPIASMAAPAPFIPSPLEAFDAKGHARQQLHDQWGATVLAFMPAADFSSQLQKSDPAGWLAIQARTVDEVRGTISQRHWAWACAGAAEINDLRRAGIAAMAHLARAIATLALQSDITVLARPIGGGQPVELGAEDWLIDDPLSRLASCAINIDDRMNVRAEPTHLIFVEPKGFEAAAWLYARRHPLSLHDEGLTPMDVGIKGPRPAKIWQSLENNVHRIMREHLLANPTDYRRPALKRVVENELGTIGSTIFERARDRLRDEFAFMREGGAPRGTERRPPAGGNVFHLPTRK